MPKIIKSRQSYGMTTKIKSGEKLEFFCQILSTQELTVLFILFTCLAWLDGYTLFQ